MRKTKFNNVLTFSLVVGGVILEMSVIKKLNDIHEEIKYFERHKGLYYDKKAYDRRLKEKLEEA